MFNHIKISIKLIVRLTRITSHVIFKRICYCLNISSLYSLCIENRLNNYQNYRRYKLLKFRPYGTYDRRCVLLGIQKQTNPMTGKVTRTFLYFGFTHVVNDRAISKSQDPLYRKR